MTWEASTPPGTSDSEWIAGFDLSVLPRPANLTDEERSDFVQGREAWMEAAKMFLVHHSEGVSGRIIGYRHTEWEFGRPNRHVTMEFGLWDVGRQTG